MIDKKMTSPFIFDATFVTGVEEMDRQHQNLVNLVNEANVRLVKNNNHNNMRRIVRELLSYAIYHFNTEESLMKEYAYGEVERADAEAHITRHREFSRQIVAVQEKLKYREYVDTEQLLAFLTDWISNHILNTDKKLARFIMSKRGD